jgi:hypothetical protein
MEEKIRKEIFINSLLNSAGLHKNSSMAEARRILETQLKSLIDKRQINKSVNDLGVHILKNDLLKLQSAF